MGAEQQQIVKNTFSITTKQNVFLIQTMNEKDLYDWLYAINPLLAGKIRYVRISVHGNFTYCNKNPFPVLLFHCKSVALSFLPFFRSSTARNRPKKISNDATPHASQGSITTPTNPMPTVTM